ncbi:MAG: 1-acyl-sn-glycerol-3-phosphate acyltransferase [Clostridiales bacterium]|nr:1-acyl-sn-glycerol-3-phosphate acyltransferase [Clostridiales bacterium]
MLYEVCKFIGFFVFHLVYRIKVTGLDNIPKDGGVIICANHANSLDPVFLALKIKRKLRFIAKKELFENKGLAWFFKKMGAFPVDRRTTDMTAYKTAIKLLLNGEALLLFTQGTRKKTIDLKDSKSGVAFFGIKAQSPIVPVGIVSEYKLFSKVRIHIGRPITLERYNGAKLKTELLNEITEETVRQIIRLTAEK